MMWSGVVGSTRKIGNLDILVLCSGNELVPSSFVQKVTSRRKGSG